MPTSNHLSIPHRLFRLGRQNSGIAVVEFALLAPLLAIVLIYIFDFGRYVSEHKKMTRAVTSGVQYFMVGGDDTSAARTIIQSGLNDALGARENISFAISHYCQCATVAAVCTANCPDGALPTAFYKVDLTASFSGILVRRSHAISDDVRVR